MCPFYEVDMQAVDVKWFLSCSLNALYEGVWTDGTWVFSTGLDQRVRCWCLSKSGKLTEHAHLIISVPEPETLDARACGR